MKFISDKIFNETNSLEELENKMNSFKDGKRITDSSTEEVLERYEAFKEELHKRIPQFDDITLIEIFGNMDTLMAMYEWKEFYNFMALLEFEVKKK